MSEIAVTTAAAAVTQFRDGIVPRGLWKVDEGNTLGDELRRICVAKIGAVMALHAPPTIRTAGTGTPDPAETPAVNEVGLAATLLRQSGYSRAEIAELLNLRNPAAVTHAIARYRAAAADRQAADV